LVKSWTFIGSPDPLVSWDGSDDAGKTVPDGSYTYRLSATDQAGNAGSASSSPILVDTEKKAVRLSTDKRAFSPNADRVNDELSLAPDVASAARVRSWTVSIANKAGDVVRTFKGTGAPPARIGWDGKTDSGPVAPDGGYIAVLEVRYTTDEVESARTVEVSLDTVAPAIRISSTDSLFSPNGDGRKDTITISQDSDSGDTWEGRISDAAGKIVRSFTWKDKAAAFFWDGSDAMGNRVPDGAYRYTVSAVDLAGNKTEKTIDRIVVDTKPTQVFVTASAAGFSPNDDKVADDISFGLIVNNKDGVSGWKLELLSADGSLAKTWSGTSAASIPAKQGWDGRNDKGQFVQGSYTARFSVDYQKGDRAEAQSASFVLDTEGPKTSLAVSPRYFSPDNDGVDDELRIALAVADASALESWTFEIFEVAVEEGSSGKKRERSFFVWSGKGKPSERLAWDGRSQRGELVESATDYPYRFTIKDELGNATVVEGVIQVDVLVIRDGDRLKIKVPSIVFRPNFADFKDLPQETVDRNIEVLKRIAIILNRFAGYKIRVEGHANSIAKMLGQGQAAIDKEENGELLPLSLSRATAVMQKLIEFGVDPKRLSVRGLGSAEPVVAFTDAENRWKNRRVEFILIKE
ncbi:MAG TPA: FlgD immunoglobulin-like domain containing protein, partial [Spirochaetales bacterium]|nr:FlgD immunoglobulin-like domain containing protein [Spirochaetales bacterium]